MSQAAPFFLSFPQFLAAPREGKLLDALRRLPVRPLSPDELTAQMAVDQALEAMSEAGIRWVVSAPEKAYTLPPRKRRLWDAYQKTAGARLAYHRAMRESHQRWIYDQAVSAGIIVPPQVEPDPAKELEKLERKGAQESIAESADSLLERVPSDAALDYVENAVGRFYFKDHWAKHRDLAKLTAWLKAHDYTDDPISVLADLDGLAQATPWRS